MAINAVSGSIGSSKAFDPFDPCGELMVCQDCLDVRNFDPDGHNGAYHCQCGGDYCGCTDCSADGALIKQVSPDQVKH